MRIVTVALYKDELGKDRYRVFEIDGDKESEITDEYDAAKAKLEDGRTAWVMARKVGRG